MSLSKRVVFRSSFLALWAVVMTTITVVLGAPPLRILRLVMGRALYWVSVVGLGLILFGVGWKALALLFLMLAVLVGFYSDLLEREWTPLSSGAVSLSVTTMFGGIGFGLWMALQGQGWYPNLVETIKSSFGKSPILNGGLKVSIEDLLLQAPSGFVVLMIVAIALLLLMEPRLKEWAGLESGTSLQHLKEFRLPDIFVWITIATLLGSFVEMEMKWLQVLSMNLLNICVLLYFFQGLAVVVHIFDWMKMSAFWRALWLVLIVLQLFLMVSVFGVMDYWIDFRQRLRRKATEANKTL